MTAMHLGSFEAIDLALDPFRQRGLGIGHRVGDVRTYVGLGGHLFGPDHGAAGPNKLYLRWEKKCIEDGRGTRVDARVPMLASDDRRPRKTTTPLQCAQRHLRRTSVDRRLVNKHTSQGEGRGKGADRDICTVRHI